MNGQFIFGIVRFFENNGLWAIWGLGLPDKLNIVLDYVRSKVQIRPGFALVSINIETGKALPSLKIDRIQEAINDLRTQRRRFLAKEAIKDVQDSLDFYRQRYGIFGKPVVTVLRFVRRTRTINGRELEQPVSQLGFGLGDRGYGSSVYGKKGVVDGYQAVYIFFTNEAQSKAVCLPLVDAGQLGKIIDDLSWQEQQVLALEKKSQADKNRSVAKTVKATLHQMGT
ncbi:MAG: hypothetical protein PHO91_01105 [Patescibacteria group bacterium]|nr:hypothetical protein [Patescibacteria group bacterium]